MVDQTAAALLALVAAELLPAVSGQGAPYGGYQGGGPGGRGSPGFDSGGAWSGPSDNPGPWGSASVAETTEGGFTRGVITGATGVVCIGIVGVAMVAANRRCKKPNTTYAAADIALETEPLGQTSDDSEHTVLQASC